MLAAAMPCRCPARRKPQRAGQHRDLPQDPPHRHLPDGPSLTPTDRPVASAIQSSITCRAVRSGAGAGQIIAIVDAYNDRLLADLNVFKAQYGYRPSTCTSLYWLAMQLRSYGCRTNRRLGRLDIEWAHARLGRRSSG